MDDEKKIRLTTLIYAILIIVVLIIGISAVLAYGTQSSIGKRVNSFVSNTLPLPAAIVNYTNIVYLKDVEKDLASIEKFYQTYDFSDEGLRVDFSTPEGRKRLQIKKREIIDKLVEDKIIEILARNKKIKISQKDIDKIVSQKLNEYGTTDEVKNDLLNSYGWSMDDFKKFVVMPSAYKAALSAYVSQNELDSSEPKAKAEQAQKELASGKNFKEVVEKYSVGASKENSGELGWVKRDQLLPELQNALFGQKSFEKNSIIESSIGFHIIEIENKKKENNEDMFQIRQIFIAKNTFADWLDNQKKDMSVWIPLSGFTWNNSNASVDFRSKEMQEFEKTERAKSVGDASIMF